MSDQLFEVAFSGQVSEGASLDDVKARVAKMFNADDAKLAQLFSGKRVVIKKNIDRATASKYETALNRAGAQCEVAPMGGGSPAAQPTAAEKSAAKKPAAAAAPAAEKPATADKPAAGVQVETGDHGDVPPPPQVDPLGISADEIEDLEASIAPVGSELQEDYREVKAPEFDLAGLDVAPVGADLNTAPKKPEPPPPDTTGITLADE